MHCYAFYDNLGHELPYNQMILIRYHVQFVPVYE